MRQGDPEPSEAAVGALILIAIGVSMDATAVAAAYAIRGAGRTDLIKLASIFGLFQFAMALAGALGGAVVTRYFAATDHWIAFGLLAFVGTRMIWGASRGHHEEGPVTLAGAQLILPADQRLASGPTQRRDNCRAEHGRCVGFGCSPMRSPSAADKGRVTQFLRAVPLGRTFVVNSIGAWPCALP